MQDLCKPLFYYSQEIPTDRIDKINAPQNALQKPSTSTPGTKYAININNRAFITRTNIPKVRILIGSAKNISTGFIPRLINAITTAAISALVKLEIVIPGITQPVNIMPRARISHLSSNIIFKTPFFIIINFCSCFTLYKVLTQSNNL